MHYQKDRVALKPPLGWNSWDCYGPAVNEVQLLGNARYMAEHLKAHGWQYVVCDIQWYEPEAGQRHWEYNRFAELCMDGFGRLIPAENRFPSAANGAGFKLRKSRRLPFRYLEAYQNLPPEALQEQYALL